MDCSKELCVTVMYVLWMCNFKVLGHLPESNESAMMDKEVCGAVCVCSSIVGGERERVAWVTLNLCDGCGFNQVDSHTLCKFVPVFKLSNSSVHLL